MVECDMLFALTMRHDLALQAQLRGEERGAAGASGGGVDSMHEYTHRSGKYTGNHFTHKVVYIYNGYIVVTIRDEIHR